MPDNLRYILYGGRFRAFLNYFPVTSRLFPSFFSNISHVSTISHLFLTDFSVISQKISHFPAISIINDLCNSWMSAYSLLIAVFRNSSHFYSFMPSLLAGFIHGLSGCSDIIHIHHTLPSPPGRCEGRWLFTYSYVLLTELMSKYSVTVYTYVD